VARLGAFDIHAVPGEAWFDDTTYPVGWFADELLLPAPGEEAGTSQGPTLDALPAVFYLVGEEPPPPTQATHGLEETSLSSPFSIDASIVPVAFSGEDFAGSLPLEEAAVACVTGVTGDSAWLPVASSPEERWGPFKLDEQPLQPTWLPPEAQGLFSSIAEDFAGSLPLEEPPTWTWLPFGAEPLPPFFAGEDFGGVHPTEEVTCAWLTWTIDPPALSSPGFEDFAGSLPLEEPAATVARVEDLTVSFGSIGEDFAGGHPTEEGFAWTPSSEPLWLSVPTPATPGEDFAGSLPLEEPAGATARTDELAVSFGSSGEDFGAAHPTEEASAWVPSSEPLWLSVPSSGEDFAGSLPLEETFAVPFVEGPLWVWGATPGEDFAGSLPLEEPTVAAVAAWVPWEPPSGGVSVAEDFAGSLPLEELAAPAWLTVDRGLAWASVTEDFVHAQPTEEAVDDRSFPARIDAELVMGLPSIPEEFHGAIVDDEHAPDLHLPFLEPPLARVTGIGDEDFVAGFLEEPIPVPIAPYVVPLWVWTPQVEAEIPPIPTPPTPPVPGPSGPVAAVGGGGGISLLWEDAFRNVTVGEAVDAARVVLEAYGVPELGWQSLRVGQVGGPILPEPPAQGVVPGRFTLTDAVVLGAVLYVAVKAVGSLSDAAASRRPLTTKEYYAIPKVRLANRWARVRRRLKPPPKDDD
jgi:hypothetical protein